MNVSGSCTLDAPREDVYRAICDPGTLMAVIPGCESIEQVGADEYVGRIALRLPGVVGSFLTTVRLVDAVPPESAGMEGRVEGSAGSISGRAEFRLAGDGDGTVLSYRGQALIQGPLARLDSRFAERLAETLVGQGLRALNQRLAAERTGPGTPEARHARTEVPE